MSGGGLLGVLAQFCQVEGPSAEEVNLVQSLQLSGQPFEG